MTVLYALTDNVSLFHLRKKIQIIKKPSVVSYKKEEDTHE
jgi:hypothetical protein